MTRWKAFLLHLVLSLVLVGGISLVALLAWYPFGLYRVAGVQRLLMLLLCFTVAAGPLLTLVVYKPGKRGLGFDLKVIALVQASFLAYGLHVLWSSRPVFLVGSDVRFSLITAGEIDPTDLAQASRPEWRKLPWRGPHLVAVALPQNPQLKAQLVQIYFDTGRDLDQLPAHYRPFDEVAAAVRRNAESLNGRDGTPNAPGGGVGLPILAGNGNAWMTVDPSTGWPVMVVMP